MIAPSQQHLYDYYIDEHGRWFCEGNLVTDPQLFRLLSRSLFEEGGKTFLRCEGEVHPVRCADVPLWIRYVNITRDDQGKMAEVEIELDDGRRESLAADTLTVANENALYCLATRRRLKARFGKIAYYELTQYLETDGIQFYFLIGGRRCVIKPQGDGGGDREIGRGE